VIHIKDIHYMNIHSNKQVAGNVNKDNRK